ncbi:MAG: hypothetical protein ABJL67_06585 [Sulfitobacter sp.]
MFRVLRLVFLLSVGAYLGFQASLFTMRAECNRLAGTWTGNLCVSSKVAE